MLTLSCEQVRAELSAYHDEEMPVDERIAIADHLDACPSCAVEANDLLAISEALQTSCRREEIAWMPGLARLQSDILERWDAEEGASLPRTIRNLFDDPQRTSASLGAALVASLCIATGLMVLAQAPIEHPESLKAILSQGSQTGDIYLPVTTFELPRAEVEAVMPAAVANGEAGDESVAFAALVTADGNLTDLEFLGDYSWDRRKALSGSHEQMAELLNAAATARFQPARVSGSPVSLNVVWLVTHRTVRAPVHAYVRVRVDGWKVLT
jgi:anti-sigma factor RsiW